VPLNGAMAGGILVDEAQVGAFDLSRACVSSKCRRCGALEGVCLKSLQSTA
jgi:hypothetical protein